MSLSGNILNWLIIGGVGFGAYLYLTGDLGSVVKNAITDTISEVDDLEQGLVTDFAENIFGEEFFDKKVECNPVWIAFVNTLNLVSWVAVKGKKDKIKKQVAYCRLQFFETLFKDDLAKGNESYLYTDSKKNKVYHVPSGKFDKNDKSYSYYMITDSNDYNFTFWLNSADLAVAKEKYPAKFKKITPETEFEQYLKDHKVNTTTNDNAGVHQTVFDDSTKTTDSTGRVIIKQKTKQYGGGTFLKGGWA